MRWRVQDSGVVCDEGEVEGFSDGYDRSGVDIEHLLGWKSRKED